MQLVPGETYYKLVKDAAEKRGDDEFVYDGARRCSFNQVHHEALKIANYLYSLGVRKNDRVLICLPNWSEFLSIYAGVSALEAILVPCVADIKKASLTHVLQVTQPKAAFVSFLEHIYLFGQSGYDDTLVLVRGRPRICQPPKTAEEAAAAAEEAEHLGLPVYSNIIKSQKEFLDREKLALEAGISTIMFTSGTTGSPKAVMHSAFAHTHVGRCVGEGLHLSPDDVAFVPISLAHIYGMSNGLVLTTANALRVVLLERYTPELSLDMVTGEECTLYFGVPTMFIRERHLLAEQPERWDLSKVRAGLIGGSTYPYDLLEEIERDSGAKILPSFGMTEVTGGATAIDLDAPDHQRWHSTGFPIHGAQIKAVDSEGNDLPACAEGEIHIRSQGIMSGYYQGGEPEPNFGPEDWFATGDVGYIDQEGYLFITGRIKDIIIRGSVNINPSEVESIYHTHPAVFESCLVGYPDSELGERSCLFVVLSSSEETTASAPTLQELRDFAKGRIERNKVPDQVRIVEEIPRLSIAKVDKEALARLCL